LNITTNEAKHQYYGLWVDNDFSFEPHLALFVKLQEAYPAYQEKFILGG